MSGRAEMIRMLHADDADPVLLGAGNCLPGGDDADPLAGTIIAVQPGADPGLANCADVWPGVRLPALDPLTVARHVAHIVGRLAAERRFELDLGDDGGALVR